MSKHYQLVRSKNVPKWIIDNPYVSKWFRPCNLNFNQCLLSIFQLHNQSANIWTHIIGVIISHYYSIYRFPKHLSNNQDIYIMSITYTGITMSYYCSVLYHIFNIGSSYEFSCFLSRLDYFGIIFHLIGCMLSLVHFAYYHEPVFQSIFFIMFVLVGCGCFYMNYHSMFTSIANRNMDSSKRTLYFIFVALLSLPPQMKIFFTYPRSIAIMALFTDCSYLMAAFIYSMKLPEKFFPGYCDLFTSHTIFHCIIILAGCASMESISMISHYQIYKSNLN